ncbi:MAG: DUF971 domain-containing protein [Pirellulaceae bacterium]
MNIHPTQITRIDHGLQIQWSDGSATQYSTRQLRDACPCATCREKRRKNDSEQADVGTSNPFQLTVLSPEETRPLEILGMRPVGNYAYNIQFSDGHDSGLFTFVFLREMSTGRN